MLNHLSENIGISREGKKSIIRKPKGNDVLLVMVLLARERDIPNSYHDNIRYWNSYNDLAGNIILFLLTMSNYPHEYYNYRLSHIDYGFT